MRSRIASPRLPFFSAVVALAFAAFLSAAASTFAASARPNVLLICVDDLKPTLGAYGDKLARTPHLDRLASSGIVFESAYTNQAVCSPSRNALMTGLRPTSVGIYDLSNNFRLATPHAITVAQHFRAQGYRTEALGKIFHTGHGNREDAASWSVPHWRPRGGSYANPENANARDAAGERLPGVTAENGKPVESADVPDNAYPDGKIADEAVARLQAAKAKSVEPFFLAVGFLKPHLPFCAPKKYWDLYDRAKFPLAEVTTAPAGAPAYAPTNGGELRNYAGVPKGPLPPEYQRELIHGYYAAVSYMDAQLGRVLDELDRSGLADNTIVVFWGDHGWHLGDHGQWCKHTNYEQAARIPIVIRAPGVTKPGSRTRSLIESVDLYPTLTELAQLAAPQTTPALDGRSVVATLRDPAAPTKEAIFHAYPRSRPGEGAIIGRAVRTARHRLVEWKKAGANPETAELELYDYVADPLETKNLAADQPQVVSRLRAILATQPEAKPPLPVANTAKKKSTKK